VVKSTPTFILSAGMRSGSTLLQRMITASGEILIWGEAGGALDRFAEAEQGYRQMLAPGGQRFDGGLGGNGMKSFNAFKSASEDMRCESWTPCMNPPLSVIHDAYRKMFDELYARPAMDLGYSRWGVKEVRSGLDTADFLKQIYPEAHIIFLVRNPIKCLLSLKRHNWMDHPGDKHALEYYAHVWLKLASDFRHAKYGLHVKYEDLITDPITQEKIMEYINVSSSDPSFVSRSLVKGNVKNDSKLSYWEMKRAKNIVFHEMKNYGYFM